MGVVFMFLCEYFGMPKEGGVVWYIGGGVSLSGSSLARLCIMSMTRIPKCAKIFCKGGGGRGVVVRVC